MNVALTQWRLQVVALLDRGATLQAVADKLEVHVFSVIRAATWAARFRKHAQLFADLEEQLSQIDIAKVTVHHAKKDSRTLSPQNRLHAIRMLDSGETITAVAERLGIPTWQVVRARGYALGIRSRGQFARDLESQLKFLNLTENQIDTESPTAREKKVACVILKLAAGPCSVCGVYIPENQHSFGDGSTVAIFCFTCCPQCAPQQEETRETTTTIPAESRA